MKYKVKSLDGEHTFYTGETQQGAMCWADNLLRCVNGFSLMSKLNDIQSDCNRNVELPKEAGGGRMVVECFPNKYEMPLIIVNLVIKEHGLKIEEGR